MVIEVLGRITISGQELTGPVARRLLTALAAAAPDAVGLDRLADVAWADEPPANPHAALHNQIARLRARVRDRPGRDVIVSDGPAYRLALGIDDLDIAAFSHEIELARAATDSSERIMWLTDALDRWHGTPFAECGDLHIVLPVRARLERMVDEARRRRIETLHELDRHDDVVAEVGDVTGPAAPDWVDEGTIALVALSTASVVDASAGARILTAHRDRLRSKGLDPGEAIRSAEQRLLLDDLPRSKRRPDERAPARRRDDGPAPRPQPLPWFGSIDTEPPLVGRLRERRLLLRSVDDVASGIGAAVSLVGDAGVGKTRLARLITDESKRRDIRTIEVSCVRGGLVRSPIETIVAELTGDAPTASRRTTPGERGDVAEADTDVAGVRLAAELIASIDAPTVIAIDDLHDADRITMTAVAALRDAVPRARCSLLVVTTSRSADADPTAIVLEPHRVDEVAALIRHATGVRPSQRLIATVHVRTGGSALAVVTGLRALAMRDHLVRIDGELDLDDEASAGLLSASNDLAVRAVVERLSPSQRELVTTLANLAPSVPLALAATALDTDVATLLDGLTDDDLRPLVGVQSGSVAFAHANVRLAIAELMPGTDRQSLHDRVVRHLGYPTTDEETMTMAWHCARSSQPTRARTVFDDAAQLSMARCDWSTALRYFHLAADVESPPAALAVRAGESAFRAFDAAEADRWYANGAARARDERDIDGWARCALGRERARLTADGVGSVDIGVLETLVRETADRPALRAELCSLLAEASFADRRIDRARFWIDEATAAAADHDDPSAGAALAFSTGLTMLGALDLPAAVERFDRSDALAAVSGEPWTSSWSRTRSALASLLAGDLGAARAMVQRAREVAEATNGSADLSLAMAIEANVCLIEGRVDEALLLSAEAESHWHRSRYPFSAPVLFPVLAECWRICDGEGDAYAALQRWRDSGVGGSTPWLMAHHAAVGDLGALERLRSERPLRLPPISDLQLGNCAIAAIAARLGDGEVAADAMAQLLDLGVRYVPGIPEPVDELLVSAIDITTSLS